MHRPSSELQALVDGFNQPCILMDSANRVVAVNESYKQDFGSVVLGPGCVRWPQSNHSSTVGEDFRTALPRAAACRLHDAQGHVRLLRAWGEPIRGPDGTLYARLIIERRCVRDAGHADDLSAPQWQMVANSPTFRAMRNRLLAAGQSTAPVLLVGDTGTGKELAAEFIHQHSSRQAGPFLKIDCSVLTPELFEVEIFGRTAEAIPGPASERQGLFELAAGGTLFLDEIGEISSPLQAKLLRVLDCGEFRRVGETKIRRADVRIVSASNHPLLDAPGFRSDLYYRIACLSIRIPSLSERSSDIPALASELLERIGRSSGAHYTLADGALKLLLRQELPGNVRELRNILYAAAMSSEDQCITAAEIAEALPAASAWPDDPQVRGLQTRRQPTRLAGPDSEERQSPRRNWTSDDLMALLGRHNGNRRAVAAELGVSERTVYRKLRELGLK